MENIFSSSFYQKVFFVNLLTKKLWVDEKVVGLMPKYSLLAGDKNQVSFVLLT